MVATYNNSMLLYWPLLQYYNSTSPMLVCNTSMMSIDYESDRICDQLICPI